MNIKLRAVTDYIIMRMDEKGQFLNLVKLQRLLYMAYAWHLAFHDGQPLFLQHFEAWKFGPVNRAIQDRFHGRSSFYSPIGSRDLSFDDPRETAETLSEDERAHLDLVLDIYGDFTAFELEDMLRYEDPWRIARVGLAVDENSSREIPDEVIWAYYKRVAHL